MLPHFRNFALLTGVLLLAPLVSAKDAGNAGEFCKLQAIPSEAIKLVTHGVDLRIFPDASAINTTFSGCQTVWLSSGFLLAQATYRKGEVTKYVGVDPDGHSVSCLYEARRLVAAAGECPPFEQFPLHKPSGRAK